MRRNSRADRYSKTQAEPDKKDKGTANLAKKRSENEKATLSKKLREKLERIKRDDSNIYPLY